MIQAYATAAVSIFLEGLFFLLIGVIVSGFIEAFVPDDFFSRFLPRNSTISIFAAVFIGLLIPVCECGIVPVISRLIKKGVPVYLALTLMLASPLINIIVITGTAYAFYDNLWIPLFRTLGGIIIPVIVGFYLKTSYQESEMLLPGFIEIGHESSCRCGSCGSGSGLKVKPFKEKISDALAHTVSDFFSTGGYFIFGILITSVLRLNMKDSPAPVF